MIDRTRSTHGKRLFILLCLLALTATGASAEEAQEPLYDAFSNTIFQLRAAPDLDSRRFYKVERTIKLQVLEYGDEWCKIFIDKEHIGYAKTEWLWRFRSYDPAIAPNFYYVKPSGVATVLSPFTVTVENYSGNTFAAGDRFAVLTTMGDAVSFPMMRGTAFIAPDAIEITPIVPHESAQPGDLISAFTTFYNERTGGDLAEGRAFNIALGCERINSLTLKSGESFSFNAVCGPYRKSNGYLMAPNISDDGEGYGGGVCQVSTTMYNALLTLPLKITRWSIHRESGVPYIPVGFDSAVGSYTDLSFINTLPYPIRVEALPQNGVVTVALYRDDE